MCGICGVLGRGREPRPADAARLDRMTDLMTHRGPDDRGVFIEGPVGLGMRRLSIIDLACGHQPMHNEDESVWVVFNGEIYNFPDLRAELVRAGHRFATASDTEVIVHGYEQWGRDVLGRLNGMFGIALWDRRERALTLARDVYGIKPLYYRIDEGELAFASEIRPLLAPGRTPRLDRRVLPDYLRWGYVPSPDTLFEGISRLRPGHALVADPSGISESRFHWRGETGDRAEQPRDGGDLVEELRTLVRSAIHRQLMADVPVGVLLSGGVDSTALAGIIAEESDVPLDVFTIGFGRDYHSDEVEFAARTAERLGLPHHHVDLSPSRFAELLPDCVTSLEEPVATASTVAFRTVCGLAAEHVKVVLTGQGADEPFGGYPRYRGLRTYERSPAFPTRPLARASAPLFEAIPRNERLKRGVRLLATSGEEAAFASMYSTLRPGQLSALLGERVAEDRLPPAISHWLREDQPPLPGLVDRAMWLDSRTILSDNLLLYGDKLSMAVSLESRVPFLDLELMERVERIPSEVKLPAGVPKGLWKEVLAPWVPAEVAKRRKIPFQAPVDEWFRSELAADLRERVRDPGSGCAAYLEVGEIERVVDEHRRGAVDHKRLLFTLLVFEIWHEGYMRTR